MKAQSGSRWTLGRDPIRSIDEGARNFSGTAQKLHTPPRRWVRATTAAAPHRRRHLLPSCPFVEPTMTDLTLPPRGLREPLLRTHRATVAALLTALSLTAGCKDDPAPVRREPPPPAATASAGACDGPSKPADAKNVAFLPPASGGFCIDPNGSDAAYGEGSGKALDEICNLFDGECEIYKRHGVERVVEARYIDGAGSTATIDVYLSRYSSPARAYAMFTKRVVGDGDPAHPDTPKPIAGGGVAALGIGNAYLWRGAHLAELTFNDTSASSAEQVKKRADELLPPLVEALGKKLPGDTEVPPSAQALPSEDRLPLGIRYVYENPLGVEGLGEAAMGYYAEGDRRWRVLAIRASDDARAQDIVKTFRKLEGAAEEKGLGDQAVRAMVAHGGPETEWLVGRRGSLVMGIGDEARVLRKGMSAEEHRGKVLDQAAKRERLGSLLAAPANDD